MNLTDKNNSFKIPESYFENQSKQLENLGKIAEIQSSFSVPPAYFEKSEQQIFELLSNKPKSRIVRLIPYAVTIAASLALALLINWPEQELETAAAVERYFEEQESPLTTIELLELNPLEDFDFKTIAFENLAQETIFELQQAYDPNFNLIYQAYED
ncbi:MAG: hypothetical protein ACKVHT_05355 [Flavobacteriales bacterium]|jgi:hypothetical protein|tara:strand:+ start:469 stop:939 length:471 start_codon:yes stop_codon:yes gene_type:complete